MTGLIAILVVGSQSIASHLPPIKAFAGLQPGRKEGEGGGARFAFWIEEPFNRVKARLTREFGKTESKLGERRAVWMIDEKHPRGRAIRAWGKRAHPEKPYQYPYVSIDVVERVDSHNGVRRPLPDWTIAMVHVSWHSISRPPKHPKEKYLRLNARADFRSSEGLLVLAPGDRFSYRFLDGHMGWDRTIGGKWKAEGTPPKGKRPGIVRRIVFNFEQSEMVGIVDGAPPTMDRINSFVTERDGQRVVWKLEKLWKPSVRK